MEKLIGAYFRKYNPDHLYFWSDYSPSQRQIWKSAMEHCKKLSSLYICIYCCNFTVFFAKLNPYKTHTLAFKYLHWQLKYLFHSLNECIVKLLIENALQCSVYKSTEGSNDVIILFHWYYRHNMHVVYDLCTITY